VKVVFRVDASLQIGSGHIMRCLTLAEALTKQGKKVVFVCRELEGNLIDYIQAKGFDVSILPVMHSTNEVTRPANSKKTLFHSSWLGTTQQKDAEQCRPILEEIQPDWLVVDHYAIDQAWQVSLKGTYQKLIVFDDLADRKHQCDILLDQTFNRKKQDYISLVPEDCSLLLGSKYALLRPEFFNWRSHSLKRRQHSDVKNLLITMGGVDINNVSAQLIELLKSCEIVKKLHITVVLGEKAPHVEVLKKMTQTTGLNITVISNVNNMAELMANMDVCIGAAGSTSWERCCLGLPTLMVVLAENQKNIAKNLKSEGAVMAIELNEMNSVCIALNSLLLNLNALTQKSISIVDGRGVDRVMDLIQ